MYEETFQVLYLLCFYVINFGRVYPLPSNGVWLIATVWLKPELVLVIKTTHVSV
jgi:hypothetical protein